MEDVRCICGGSKAILSKLLSVDTLLCGGGGRGRQGRGVAFLNFLRDVNDILYPTTTTTITTTIPTTTTTASVEELQQEAATLAQNEASVEAVSQKLEAVLEAANTRTGRAAAPTCAAFIALVKQCRFFLLWVVNWCYYYFNSFSDN